MTVSLSALRCIGLATLLLVATPATGFGEAPGRPGALQLAFNAEVQRIQGSLNQLGYDAGPSDGLMGARTRRAIEDYQRDHGLLVTGQASASLERHMAQELVDREAAEASPGTVDTPSPATQPDRQLVLDVQSGLRRLGYSVPVISGRLDSDTETAIRAYQRDHRLLIDGRLSAQLAEHIAATTAEDGVLEDRATTQAVQRELNTRGYDAGPADGVMGNKTRDALRTFQSDAGLPLTGKIDNDLLVGLGLAAAAPFAGAASTDTPASGPVTVVTDSFEDGDYTKNPRWEVAAGKWSVTDGGALTSEVSVRARASSPELGPDLIKDLLGGALGLPSQQQRNLAAIHVPAAIPASFHLRVRLSGAGDPATLNLGFYQGNNIGYGYRLESRSSTARPLRLLAITEAGSSVVATAQTGVRLDDGAKHSIDWRRDANGLITVELDGAVALQARDDSFRESFAGLSVINAGGEWSIDEIRVDALAP